MTLPARATEFLKRIRDEQEEHLRLMQSDPDYRAEHERKEAERRAEEAKREYGRACWARERALSQVGLRESVERMLVRDEGVNPTKAFSAIEKWMASNDVPPIIVLAGGVGCGKTVAAAWALAKDVDVNTHACGRWTKAQEVVRFSSARFGEEAAMFEKILHTRLLVVDDVGTESEADRMCAALIEIIDSRQHSAKKHRTVLTTNLSKQAFRARYQDERLHSRMAQEHGVVAWVGCPDADLRKVNP